MDGHTIMILQEPEGQNYIQRDSHKTGSRTMRYITMNTGHKA
jgi:hypothetical protein